MTVHVKMWRAAGVSVYTMIGKRNGFRGTLQCQHARQACPPSEPGSKKIALCDQVRGHYSQPFLVARWSLNLFSPFAAMVIGVLLALICSER